MPVSFSFLAFLSLSVRRSSSVVTGERAASVYVLAKEANDATGADFDMVATDGGGVERGEG